jgi:hypothetical protein
MTRAAAKTYGVNSICDTREEERDRECTNERETEGKRKEKEKGGQGEEVSPYA